MYETFKALLEQTGKTPAQVSRDTGINSTVFSEWKKGKSKPKADKLYTLAKYFGVPMEIFMEE